MAKVSELCGEYPSNFIKLDISNDPTFVFENDPNYTIKQLFDSEGNTVSVNSFMECEHYVSGGWGSSPIKNTELFLQDSLFYFVLLLLVISFFNSKFQFIKKLWD
tara:strand:+ start:101 stop:415 length:315 start_codon:yes stop_codon:yes gene_type:complete